MVLVVIMILMTSPVDIVAASTSASGAAADSVVIVVVVVDDDEILAAADGDGGGASSKNLHERQQLHMNFNLHRATWPLRWTLLAPSQNMPTAVSGVLVTKLHQQRTKRPRASQMKEMLQTLRKRRLQ